MESFKLNNGVEIPAMGYGVFQMTSVQVEEVLPQAIDLGMRHIDTANGYFNEVAVGKAVRESGIDRSEFFITSKLWPRDYGKNDCMRALDATLERLDMDYLDLVLFHQPYGAYTEGWKVLEEALAAGKVRAIGLSNFNQRKFQEILDVAEVTPQVLQVEAHPYWDQREMRAWLAPYDVRIEAWYPLGHGDAKLINEPVFVELARKYGKMPAQVILRWHFQMGNVTFPKTLNPAHISENLDIFDFQLTDEEMARIATLQKDAPYYTVPDEMPEFVKTMPDFAQQS